MSATGQSSTAVFACSEEAGGPALVLVVEDDAALLALIERGLAAHGHRAVGVTDGLSALAWLREHTPNLMLLDYSLPDMQPANCCNRSPPGGWACRSSWPRDTAAKAWLSK